MGLCASAPTAEDGRRSRREPRSHRSPIRKAANGPQNDAAGATVKQEGRQPGGGRQRALARVVLGDGSQCGGDVRSHFAFDRVLGKGQFGVTRLVVDIATGEQCACKSISKRKLVTDEDVEDVRREIKVMHHLSGHPHVVAFKGAYEDENHVHIVMELCTGGELFEQLSSKGHYRERDAAHIMRTLLQVVQHCHAMNVVHRDLKPENFLFKDGNKRNLKAIDFGLSAFFTQGSQLRDLVGSPFYMAPEVLRRCYGKAADVWSCGVICYILLCGWPPFYGANAQQIFRSVLHDSLDLASPPWDSVSSQAKDCVRRMLMRDPRKRADVASILAHEWMQAGRNAPEPPLQPEILRRMRMFANMNRFKKEALRVVATHLPPEEIEGIRQMFMDMDSDGSGTISFTELREGLRRKGASVADAELQRIMVQVDLDGNNTLDFKEFLTATVFLGKLQRRENLMAAFQHFDSDGSGFITEEELLLALQEEGVSCAAVQRMLDDVDRDNNRRIDYDEFARMMLSDDSDRRYTAGGTNGGAPELPGSAGDAEHASSPRVRTVRRADSNMRHTLRSLHSGAWIASQHHLDGLGMAHAAAPTGSRTLAGSDSE